jgi:chromosome segregation ATPase
MPVSVRWKVCSTQERIIAEQRVRLDQFDVTYELLDTATRGNKSRIEAVREQAEKQHAIVEARIEGLSALQREHHAEFQTLQGLVGVLQSETQRLDAAIGELPRHWRTIRGQPGTGSSGPISPSPACCC